jgi:hypothetical protein
MGLSPGTKGVDDEMGGGGGVFSGSSMCFYTKDNLVFLMR